MGYDPFDDEKKQMTLKEFIANAKEELDKYEDTWSPPNSNDFHEGTHTWNEWYNSFHRYMSW